MCGISGLLHYPDPAALSTRIQHLNTALQHRGPDASGYWLEPRHGLALGHQRLSIQDLSAAGQQPMHSPSGRYVCVFNGEIYNHLQLQQQLDMSADSPPRRGHSDTETLLGAFDAWGITATLPRCTGMFALAVWDRHEQTLWLIRDRMGEKPLYYARINDFLAFASELKALHTLPEFHPELDRSALRAYLQQGCVPAPASIYQNTWKLQPGCLLRLQVTDALEHCAPPYTERWWSFRDMTQQALQHPLQDQHTALQQLEQQLQHSVKQQLLADVPVGVFLSGGVDSALIASSACRSGSSNLQSFTIGFQQARYDESRQAAWMARRLQTRHHEQYMTAQDACQLLPDLPEVYSEPFADASQLPTLLLSRFAAPHITVALAGDGGDELFGGYTSYVLAPKLWQRLGKLPAPLRRLLAHTLLTIAPRHWDQLGNWLGKTALNGNNLHKLGDSLHDAHNLPMLFRRLGRRWQHPQPLLLQEATPPAAEPWHQALTPHQAMMLEDSENGLPDMLLCKLDRAAMSTGLETRLPFLDHAVLELAWRMAPELKIRAGQGKWLLRQLLQQQVPELAQHPPDKRGFSVPLENWLRHELRDWAEDLLDPHALQQQGLLDAQRVRQEWQAFLAGKTAGQQRLWTVLMFQSWRARWSSSA
ncbi:MAG: asparagine synthase (glutamine-hydrolyzing) [Thiolinea sp.]